MPNQRPPARTVLPCLSVRECDELQEALNECRETARELVLATATGTDQRYAEARAADADAYKRAEALIWSYCANDH
jgi:hypothetical protein